MGDPDEKRGFIDSFFDKADAFLGGVERAIVPKDTLWQVDEIYDHEAEEGKQTMFVVSNSKDRVHCWNKIIAKRIADALND